MTQAFRHVLRGMDPAAVEAHAAAHRKPWWRGRHLSIRVEGGRIKASRPATRLSQPPVLRGTLRTGAGGTVVEGELHRRVNAAVNATYLLVAIVATGVAVAAFADGAPAWLGVGAIVTTVVFVLVYAGVVVAGGAAREAEASELKGELDVFFGLRERS